MEEYNLLEVENLKLYYHTDEGDIKAIDDLSFSLKKGETLGIIGESISGKTDLGKALLNIRQHMNEVIEGEVRINGRNIVSLSETNLRKTVRWVKIALISKDSATFFTPLYTIKKLMLETVKEHLPMKKKEAMIRVFGCISQVGLSSDILKRYPYELSNEVKCRIVIATAMLLDPEVLICDEPTITLDVIAQAQIINLLKTLRKELSLSYIYMTQEPSVLAEVADRILVMYAGKVVESCTNERFYCDEEMHHPYSHGLLNATPRLRKKNAILNFIPGSPPNLINPAIGCHFQPRCDRAIERCRKTFPPLIEAEPGHFIACWRYTS